MTTPELPEDWADLLAGYALDTLNAEETDLSPEEAERLQHLLETHPRLQTEAANLQEVLALMPYALPEAEPPPHLRTAILSAVQGSQTDASIAARPQRRRLRWQPIAGAVAAATIAALLADNLRLRQQSQTTTAMLEALQQPDTLVYALEGTEAAAAASGRLVVSPQQRSIWVAVNNLPELPAGQAYRLWALADPDAPTYCGQFNSDPAGTTVHWTDSAPSCQTAVPQMLITAESASAPPVPAGELVLRSVQDL